MRRATRHRWETLDPADVAGAPLSDRLTHGRLPLLGRSPRRRSCPVNRVFLACAHASRTCGGQPDGAVLLTVVAAVALPIGRPRRRVGGIAPQPQIDCSIFCDGGRHRAGPGQFRGLHAGRTPTSRAALSDACTHITSIYQKSICVHRTLPSSANTTTIVNICLGRHDGHTPASVGRACGSSIIARRHNGGCPDFTFRRRLEATIAP